MIREWLAPFPYLFNIIKTNHMKKFLTIATIFCIGICTSCDSLADQGNTGQENTETPDNSGNNDSGQGEDTVNQLVGTTWEWSEDPITWTFTFSENEVTFDYKAVFSPNDISTSQYKSTYTYLSGIVKFDMKVWSGIVWECTGNISGNTMELASEGAESWEIVLKKK